VWLIVNCFAWVAVSLTNLLAPQYESTVYLFASPIFFGEIAIMLWLLITGANVKRLPVTATREERVMPTLGLWRQGNLLKQVVQARELLVCWLYAHSSERNLRPWNLISRLP